MAYIDITTRVYVPEPSTRKVTEKLAIDMAALARDAVRLHAEKEFGTKVRVSYGYEYAYIKFAKRIVSRLANSAAPVASTGVTKIARRKKAV